MASSPILLDWTSERLRAWSLPAEGPAKAIVLDGQNQVIPLVISMAEKRLQMGQVAKKQAREHPHQVLETFLPYLGRERRWQHGRYLLDARDAVYWVLCRLKEKLPGKVIFQTVPTYWSREQAAILEDCTRLAGYRSLGIMARGPALGGDTAGLLIDVDSFACSWIQTSLQHRTGNLQVEKTRCLPELAISIWSERIGTFIASKCLMESRRDPRVNGATDQQLFEQIEMRLSDWASQYDATLHIQQHHWQEELVIRASDVTQLCLPLAEQLCRNLPAPGELNALYLSHEAGRLPGLAQALYRQGSHQQVVTILPEDTHVKNLHVWIQRIEQGLHPVLKLTDPFPTGEATPENRADTLPFPKRK